MNERQYDMTGAWALNALDENERAQVQEYLAQDPTAADEARSFEETAGELARGLEPEAPRPALKDSVMARIAQTRQLPPQPTQDTEPPVADPSPHAAPDADVVPLDRYLSTMRSTRWLAVAAATLLVTSVAGFGLWGTERAAQQESQATIAAMESAQADAEREQRMAQAIMAADDAAHMTMPAETGGSLQLMYSREQEAMVVRAADLPELPSGSTYQLWLIDDGTMHGAGMITDAEETVMMHDEMPPAAQLALTVEPAGGSEQPTSPMIAQGDL